MNSVTPGLPAAESAVERAPRRRLLLLLTSPRAAAVIAVLAVVLAFGLGFVRARATLTAVPAESAAAVPAVAASRPAARGPVHGSAVPDVSTSGLQWPLWEYKLQQPLQARESPLTPVSWRLLGAVLDQGQWKIIVMRQGKDAPEFFKVGEKLPGGYLIREITQDDVTLVAGRRELILAYIGSR